MFEKTKELLGISNKSQDFVPLTGHGGFDSLFGNQYNNKEVRQLNRTDYLSLYTGWVYFCVSRISQTVASLEKQVVNDKFEVVADNYQNVINYDLIEGMTAFLLLNGSAFGKKTSIGNRIQEINLLRPDLIEFKQNIDTGLTGYKYRLPNGQYQNVSVEDMIDIHFFNPLEVYPNKTKGISPVQAVASQMSTDIATQNWDWKFFENGATPSGVFTTQSDVNSASLDRFKQDWKSKYSGVKNSHKTAVLPYGVDYRTITPSQNEMDFVNKRRFTKEEVLTIFGIPEALFDKNTNQATAKVAEKAFMKFTILPIAKKIEQALNKKVYKTQGTFRFTNIIPADIEQLNIAFQSGGITLNEYRQELNYDPLKSGNVLNTFLGQIEVELQEEKINRVNIEKQKNIETALKKAIRGTEEWKEAKHQEKLLRLSGPEQKYKKVFTQIFEIQEKDMINEIASQKDTKVKKPKWNNLKYATLYFSLLQQPQEELYQNEGNAGLQLAGIESFFVIGDTLRNGFLRDNIRRIATDIDNTTKDEIFKLIEQGDNEGLGVAEITNNIRSKFTQYKASRVETIVRTETIFASSRAYETAWENSGVVKEKEWFTALDERVCIHCNSLNGQRIALGGDFFKKGSTMQTGLKLDYRNIGESPLHANCRCTLLPVTDFTD